MKNIKLSPSGNYRSVIDKENDDTYKIYIEKYTQEIVPGYGEVCEPFWNNISKSVMITENLQQANDLAVEELRNLSGE